MPVHNGARYIAVAIESVLVQTLQDYEIIIFDNASTDATESICRSYAAKDVRLRYHRNAKNLGAHPNYNLTFRHARGKYFKWAAHDDVLQPTYLEKCVAALENAADAVICQSYLRYIDANGRDLGVYDSRLKGTEKGDAPRRFAGAILPSHPAYEIMGVFRRSTMEGSLLLQSFHGSDRALVAEMSLRGRLIKIEEPLLLVRDHAERYTHSRVRPKDRAVWHDTRLAGRISLPTWRLYYEYWQMIGRNLSSYGARARCYGHLARWWWHNWNCVRMIVDLGSVVFPDSVVYAERFKQNHISPQPGQGDVRARAGDSK